MNSEHGLGRCIIIVRRHAELRVMISDVTWSREQRAPPSSVLWFDLGWPIEFAGYAELRVWFGAVQCVKVH